MRNAKKLVIASDYGGDHGDASHTTVCFLIASAASVADWTCSQKIVRSTYLGDGRRLSYKGLNDKHKRLALAPFLAAANRLNGVVVTFLIDKRLISLFQAVGKLDKNDPDLLNLPTWKSSSVERMFRITHIASLLLRGLSGIHQDVLWVTDEDAIVANESRLRQFVSAFGNVASHYLSHDLGHIRVATTASDNGTRDVEDLVAISDIVAGALTDVLADFAVRGGFASIGLTMPDTKTTKAKARKVMDWFSDDRHPLRRVVCVVDQGTTAKYRVSCVRFHGSSDAT